MNKVRLMLKKYFIPHKGNDHRPHMLRTEKALVVFSIVLLVETLFLAQVFLIGKTTNFLASVISSVLVDKTNDERESADLYLLTPNESLELAAELKAEDMAKKGYFAHTTPEGHDPWYWLYQAGYNFAAAGENLAVNFTDSEDVIDAWMDSPGHRANILKENYTEIGIATAKGEYKGRQAIFVVQFFGTPSSVQAKTITAEATPVEAIPAQTPTSTKKQEVASEEVVKEPIVEEEEFIQTEPIEVVQANNAPVVERQSSFVRKIASEPKTVANSMLVTLATIIAVALLLFVFEKTPIKHPPLIVNGVVLLLIMSSAILLNQYLSTLGATV